MTQRRLLLVEDDQAFGRIVALILEDQVDVHCVGDADQALAALAEFEPDAIVSDMNMPRMSGVDLYRKIQTNHATRKIPFALITGLQTIRMDRYKKLGPRVSDKLLVRISAWMSCAIPCLAWLIPVRGSSQEIRVP